MPQIEVTFDIDANGILHVSAKDKATGKENKITIKASSGLSEDEIQRMVKDAEAHADDDKKQLELVQARNALDALVHSVKKSLAEYGDKIDADEKAKIEAALKDVEDAAEGQGRRQGSARGEGRGARQGRAEAGRDDVRAGAGRGAGDGRTARAAGDGAGGGGSGGKAGGEGRRRRVHGGEGQEVLIASACPQRRTRAGRRAGFGRRRRRPGPAALAAVVTARLGSDCRAAT